ncbi:MAG: RNA polymerase factor sigma-54 [Candidatus Accumulibacter sp.]|jgi:RNA polymerase sigma-54 factor|nr:RNA polymerase factor sigma-54 [Accumulibacter sp.]
MKPSLQLKLSQHLALTPQLQQSIRLLQLSTLELEQELEKYLLENPLLEREEDAYAPVTAESPTAAIGDEEKKREEAEPAMVSGEEESWQGEAGSDDGAYANSSGSFDDDDNDFRDIQVAATSLREHLSWQLGLVGLPARDRTLAQCLIDALDDDGYLTQAPEDLADLLPRELEIETGELQIALHHLQNLDPPGVGARNVRECLALQLEALPGNDTRTLALRIVREHLDLLAGRDFAKLKKSLECDDEQLREAQFLIRSLNPRPGAKYAALDAHYITPDVVVRKVRGQWTVSINSDVYPRLRINSLYAQILSRQRGSGLSGQLQEARWLIKNVQQRFDTILRVAQAIVDRQRQFFEHGEVAMRPMVLREIADALGLHESTVSRVTTQKYMATPRGIFELKYFFGSYVATEVGGACSATAIRALIKQLVGAEDAKKPLSDSQIADLLGQQGIVVARRTIAKYREALGIPPVKLRKAL